MPRLSFALSAKRFAPLLSHSAKLIRETAVGVPKATQVTAAFN